MHVFRATPFDDSGRATLRHSRLTTACRKPAFEERETFAAVVTIQRTRSQTAVSQQPLPRGANSQHADLGSNDREDEAITSPVASFEIGFPEVVGKTVGIFRAGTTRSVRLQFLEPSQQRGKPTSRTGFRSRTSPQINAVRIQFRSILKADLILHDRGGSP